MNRKTRKRLVLTAIALALVAALVWGFLPEPVSVDMAQVVRGPLQVIVEEEGETRVRHLYAVSSPVPAFARRVELEEGDTVEQGQEIVHLEPPRSTLLDPRTRAEARRRLEAAEANLAQARDRVRGAEAVAERTTLEHQRVERLFETEAATRQRLEQARAAADQARAELDGARRAVETARAELATARATLQDHDGGASLPVQQALRAPVSGRVIRVHHESEGHVSPGQPLIEIGDTADLEVRADVLSEDAVRIRPGSRVLFDQWGGDAPLEGIVERIEPQGVTEISSLGVEEQRVSVLATLTSPPEAWASLGAGYRVLARFIVWEGEEVLTVPTSALFRTDDGWAAFVVEDGTARRRPVEIGHQSGLRAQVLAGLAEGDTVIVHPDRSIEDGTPVKRFQD